MAFGKSWRPSTGRPVPVLMNTSFNGPGEPIVETPAHAVAFLQNSDIDVVYIEGRRAVRDGAA